MVDFLIPVNNVQMAICDNLVSVMKNVFCGRGLGVWSNPNGKNLGSRHFLIAYGVVDHCAKFHALIRK
jgi:hypothetical protein